MPSKRLTLPTLSPKRQLANQTAWNQTRPAERARLFTLGYSGKKIDALIELLHAHGIATLVDIRHNSTSLHRPEMSKSNLSATLEQAGIAYVHAPDLGIPNDVRKQAMEAASRQVLWDWYDAHVLQHPRKLKTRLEQFAAPCVVMCMELDPTECHRHRLALALEAAGLPTHDL